MTSPITLQFDTQDSLESFAADLTLFARPGMVVLLQGDLGAGKSTLARAFIRALAPPDADFDIPSPTFTLVQTYDETRIPVAHADLYRIGSAQEAEELGLHDLLKTHVLLVEWPEHIMGWPLADALHITLSGGGQSRSAAIVPAGAWMQALARNDAIRSFLAGAGFADARRAFLEGDASFRRYETLTRDGDLSILMDMPARPDGPIVRDGKPYSAIAHLAEDIRAVVAVNAELCRRGYAAPETRACDLAQGLAVITDLGRAVYGRMRLAGEDMEEPMRAAIAVLADMAASTWPGQVAAGDGTLHHISPYDSGAQMIEVDLLASWFWPYVHGTAIPPEPLAAFHAIWTDLLVFTQAAPRVWTLRDYHSPNLLWRPNAPGLKRVGLIDTQDCVLGHPAYDLASLLQDARVDIPAEEAARLYAAYIALRASDSRFDHADFDLAYAILGAQRATKILGIFARLSKRDGKHGYLRHVPRVSRYLEASLTHPRLSALKHWFDTHLPASVRERGLS